MTGYEELNLLRSWEADARKRAELLATHLKAVLEVAYTWQPDYATKMDMDTLAFAATEVGFEPSNAQVHGLATVPCSGGLEQSINEQTTP